MSGNSCLAGAVAANWRLAHEPVTGVTRCAQEILRRLPEGIKKVSPARRLAGAAGHAWEQTLLPGLTSGKLLWNPNCTGPLAVRRQVITVHDLAPIDHPEWFRSRFARWYRFLLPSLARRAARIICVSEFSRRRLLECTQAHPEQTVVIPNGVDDRFHPVNDRDKDAALASLDLPSRFVLALGSIEPRKNLPRLLQAWTIAQKQLDEDICLVVAGGRGGDHIFASSELGSVPPRVRLIGRVDDGVLPALYTAATAFVYPSLYEGFGLPPLEAMACGAPVVSSDIPAIRETTKGAALLVDPYSTTELAEAVVRVLTDMPLRMRLRASGMAVAAEYSWTKTADSTWQVLTQLV